MKNKISSLKTKEKQIGDFQNKFTEEVGLGSCFVVAGALMEEIGGKVCEGFYGEEVHWWVEKDGLIIDFNCMVPGKQNTFVFGKSKEYKKEWNTDSIEEVRKNVDSEGLMNPEDYDKYVVEVREILN